MTKEILSKITYISKGKFWEKHFMVLFPCTISFQMNEIVVNTADIR